MGVVFDAQLKHPWNREGRVVDTYLGTHAPKICRHFADVIRSDPTGVVSLKFSSLCLGFATFRLRQFLLVFVWSME